MHIIYTFVVVKKGIVILLLVLYSVSTIGATINMHYCMNKFAGWSLTSEKKEKCAKCGMANTGCCKDEKKQIKITLDQQKGEYTQSTNFNPLVIVNTPGVYSASHFIIIDKQSLVYFHAPPLILKKNIQAFFATFLI